MPLSETKQTLWDALRWGTALLWILLFGVSWIGLSLLQWLGLMTAEGVAQWNEGLLSVVYLLLLAFTLALLAGSFLRERNVSKLQPPSNALTQSLDGNSEREESSTT